MQKMLLFLSTVLIVSGCNSTQENTAVSPTTPPDSAEIEEVKSESNEMAAAFSTGASIKCDVTKEGQANSHYMVKNKRMKMVTDATTENPDQFFSINDGTFIYIWSSDASKPGTKMSLEEVKNAADTFDNQFQQFPDISDQSVRDDIQDSGFTMNCAPAEIADGEFVPPTNVTFTNPMELLKTMMEKQPAE